MKCISCVSGYSKNSSRVNEPRQRKDSEDYKLRVEENNNLNNNNNNNISVNNGEIKEDRVAKKHFPANKGGKKSPFASAKRLTQTTYCRLRSKIKVRKIINEKF